MENFRIDFKRAESAKKTDLARKRIAYQNERPAPAKAQPGSIEVPAAKAEKKPLWKRLLGR